MPIEADADPISSATIVQEVLTNISFVLVSLLDGDGKRKKRNLVYSVITRAIGSNRDKDPHCC